MTNEVQAAVRFFKSEQAYKKLFHAFRKKYESLGRIGGTVPVRLFTDGQLKVIGGFFGMPGSRLAEKGSISVAAFERQLADTRFGDIGLKQILDAYFGETILSKKQQREEKEKGQRCLVIGLQETYTALSFWFDELLANSSESRWVWTLIDKTPDKFAAMTAWLDIAQRNLPESPERLPMFSQRIAGDPHAFDLNTDLGKLWLHVLAVQTSGVMPTTTETTNELLQDFQIYRDDLLNYVTCAGLYAETETGRHPVWESAVDQQTVQIVPIRELMKLVKVYPAYESNVWVVENSGVCATLLDHKPDMPIVCTNGQFTLAALMLLDRLAESGCVLHYAGDFDPEGLGMAQRLLNRYPTESAKLWHMNADAYAASRPVKKLSEERLEKLNRIEHMELAEVAEIMRAKGKAGYQEALVERMMEDI
ncbi:TIGR02679 family protein [Lentibacillus sp. CBA3610]|uniref:TIGR02679 family protein n=1 Tax=Lentibacillus sp. CBA3610 TaxID=2518176 RepID=UPI001595E5F7|nr:TIGR02679 family protein [Lentibacillus sp. CBA3610]QKY69980.1 TIGR02679 family protein [Lentibacillus sp. CBA3610]